MQQDFNPQAERRKNTETDKYVLFLTSEFSQWFPSDFQDAAGRKFNCAEQYMMFRKAELFGDIRSTKLIIEEGVTYVGKTEVNPNKVAPTAPPPRITEPVKNSEPAGKTSGR